jgi:hypothetical protein
MVDPNDIELFAPVMGSTVSQQRMGGWLCSKAQQTRVSKPWKVG